MKHQLGKIKPLDTVQALRSAEAGLVRPEGTGGGPVFVHVPPQDIRERLELFQPRRPGWGTRTLETKHVNELAKRINLKGDMDPVLLVKIDDHWVVVDGHHRLAAYRKLKHTDPIECEWFTGSAREAMDESLKRNEKAHLRVDQGDRAEAAWARTLIDWDGNTWRSSKKQVVTLTGCSEGVVAHMRRVVRWHYEHATGQAQTPMGETLCEALGHDLRKHSWNKVHGVAVGLTPKEANIDDAAAKLSRNLTTRMTTKLSEDPEVTAHALWLYDRDLCLLLVDALQRCIKEKTKAERGDEDQASYEDLEARQALSALALRPEAP
jgi:hypothetical protein